MDSMGHETVTLDEIVNNTEPAARVRMLKGELKLSGLKQEALAEIREIASKNGEIRAEHIVKHAEDVTSSLHDYFEWDNTEAAKQYRLQQAGNLIRRIHVTIETHGHEQITVRAYPSLESDREAGGGAYRPIVNIMRSKTKREELLEQAIGELKTFESKYKALSELAPVFSAASKVIVSFG